METAVFVTCTYARLRTFALVERAVFFVQSGVAFGAKVAEFAPCKTVVRRWQTCCVESCKFKQ